MAEKLDITRITRVLAFEADLALRTALLVKSGLGGELSDSVVERAPDGRLHVNGYAWASLLRRALGRLKAGQDLAARIGGFHRNAQRGINPGALSPLWTEASFAAIEGRTAIVPGIKVHREWGATATGGLYSDEIVLPGIGLKLSCRWLCREQDDPGAILARLMDALWVVDSGIETIGGGWSYGYGRLAVKQARHGVLDLATKQGRQAFGNPSRIVWEKDQAWEEAKPPEAPAIGKPWMKLTVKADVLDGQLLAIHTTTPPLGTIPYADIPDTFVYTRPKFDETGKAHSVPIITGKAFRQALLSAPIERSLRSRNVPACLDTTHDKRTVARPGPEDGRRCLCPRCLWFGDTDAGGIISVADAEVAGPDAADLHRIQLCEHSFQNINLFSGEYLTAGTFVTEIVIDRAHADRNPDGLEEAVRGVLAEMKSDRDRSTPPGWHRLGATTTCTGQVEVIVIGEERHG